LKKIEKEIHIMLNDSCNLSMRTFKEENRIAINEEYFGEEEKTS
jgi:hypothetical protein